MEDQHIAAYLAAGSALLEHTLKGIARDDPDAATGLANILRAGGMMNLRSTFAPGTGLAHLAVEVVEPGGHTHALLAAEWQSSALQK